MYQMQILLRKQLAAAWSYRWIAVLFSWLVCAGGWIAVMNMPNVYESSARMYIDADAILTPLLRGLAVDTSLSSQLELLQRTLLSRPNVEKLISKTDLDLQVNSPAERTALADRLANEIKISPETRNLFRISYRNSSPKLAYDVVQATLTAFIESKAGTNRSDLENANRFLESQLNLYERQLRDTERRRAEFRTKYLDLLPNDGGVGGLDGAIARVKSLQGQLEDAQMRRASLAKELAQTQPLLVVETDGGPGAPGSTTSRLQAAERQLQELRFKYTDQHPDVIAAKQMIAALKSGQLGPDPSAPSAPSQGAVRPGSRSVPNPVYEQMKVRLVENDSNIASLQRQITEATAERDRLDKIAKSAPGLQAEAINLDRDYQVLRRNYDELVSRREQMRISAAADASADKVKIQIIDPPLVPTTPVAPKRVFFLTGVLAAGLGAGLGLALLLVQLDQSFRTTDDLRGLGYPVVGGVSMLAASVPFLRRAMAVGSFALAVFIPCAIYGGLILRLLRSGGSA